MILFLPNGAFKVWKYKWAPKKNDNFTVRKIIIQFSMQLMRLEINILKDDFNPYECLKATNNPPVINAATHQI